MLHPKKSSNRIARVVVVPVLAGTLVVTSFVGAFAPLPYISPSVASAAEAIVTYKLVKQDEQIVTSGVKQINYSWVPSSSSKTTEQVHVFQIDLTNPYVQLNAMSGKNGSVTSGQSVGNMVKATGAIAGINGDVFNTGSASEGAPMGAEIISGQMIVSPSKLQGMFAFAVTKDKQPIIDQFSFSGSVTAEDGATFNLAGMNQSSYTTYPDKTPSHVGTMYIYTNKWTAAQRPANSGATPTEALVVDGVVTEIGDNTTIATAIPENGYILRGHREAADFIRTHLAVGTKVSSNYGLTSMTNGKSYAPDAFQMVVSGHTILIDSGRTAAFSRDISGVSGSANRARTAAAYSKDGKTAYLVTVEENGSRKGVTLANFQKILLGLGAWKAVNLDGGGSTTMISRPLGDFATVLAHPTSYGTTQRVIANGIGVYTIAPAGATKGIVASGPKTLLLGQQATYALKAYDTYYNPLDPAGLAPQWSVSGGVGTFQDGVLTATKPGKAKLTVKSGAASNTVELEVIGADQVAKLTVDPSTTVLAPGTTISAPVKAQLKDGRTLDVPATSVKWEFRGFTASKDASGKLTIDAVSEGATAGYAIARYDGFSTMFTLAAGTEKPLETFENVGYDIGFTGLPAETQGSAAVVSGLPGRETSKALRLTYDFNTGSGSRFAYALLNGGNGIPVAGKPSVLSVDALGDGSYNWLRAEFKDAGGKQVFVTIAKTIDWTGWKTFRIDLAAAGLTAPATLTKLYVVNLEEDQDERALQGQVAFDNLTLQYAPASITTSTANIVMTVSKKEAKVNGKAVKLDTAPQLLNGTTYLPLRFVSDALGGQTDWNAANKQATVLRGGTLLDLWVGGKELVSTGVRQEAAAAPILQNGRVLVPVRVVSEQLGQKVDWDPKTKTITIH
ncbi:stalk domain-containing protein [Cohnella nanjingensis]|uniref:Phosphodiester glycosidase family protein n=1 Tax=Cohnella nanjingensis TaxID=1387779 RepID=A0A7X0RNP3_9BACL|nr:stalk domain-containing protein [Cohnella nanjingensis]MBB6670633.1 phosphodiester glycosidase family protein [Cohnella nanjingensis]